MCCFQSGKMQLFLPAISKSTTILKFRVGKIFLNVFEKGLMLTEDAIFDEKIQ